MKDRLETAIDLLRSWRNGGRPVEATDEFLASEERTDPATPVARRISSGNLKAVKLPEPGLDRRVADKLAEGKEPVSAPFDGRNEPGRS